MTRRVLTWCTWCGPVFVVLLFAGILLMHLLPPPSPSDDPAQLAHFWQAHPDLKRLGVVLIMTGAGFTAPFSVAVAVQLRRMEGELTPMTYLQLVGAATGMVAILVPTLMLAALPFRPDRPDAITQALTDLALIPFVINFPPAVLQMVSVAVATLGRPERQVFPRWVGFYNLWVAFLLLPGALLEFVKHGAFAWNGLLSFWVVASIFGSWYVVMAVVLRRSFREFPA